MTTAHAPRILSMPAPRPQPGDALTVALGDGWVIPAGSDAK